MTSPRERMVVSAALLIRERGAQPTAIADVLEHSGAPAARRITTFLVAVLNCCVRQSITPASMLRPRSPRPKAARRPRRPYRVLPQAVASPDYRAGCPVVAVTVEAGDPAKQDQPTPVIDRAAAAFARWTDLIAQRLVADGVSAARAEELAMLTTTAIEGAIVVARASRDLKPLDLVHGQLRDLLQAEISERKSSDG